MRNAEVAELADARDSNSRFLTELWVQFPPSAQAATLYHRPNMGL
jgi:hypothetical protein